MIAIRPLLATPLLLLAAARALPAQTDEQFLQASFQRLDQDGDGALVRKEFPGSDRQFMALDADKDGKATFAEFRDSEVARALLRGHYRNQQEAHARTTPQQLAPERLRWLQRWDRNHDGKVTRDEWTGSDDAFTLLDLDGNGVLDKRDRSEAIAAAPPPPPELPDPKGEAPTPEALLARHDKDKDGRLSGKELADKWLAAALAVFDSNGDGALDEQELRALCYTVMQRRSEAAAGTQRPQPYDVPFDAWDKDKDGKVRQNEWQGPLDLFLAIDLDRDSAVSRDELLRYRKRVTGEDFMARFDLDGDGKVTLAEFGGPPAAFQRADTNHDGVVTRQDK
jgi:Ca2+-binding EF-hand superfamily protein